MRMERADGRRDNLSPHRARRVAAIGCALVVHGFLFAIFSFVPEKRLAEPTPPVSVQLIILGAPLTPITPEFTPTLPPHVPTPSEPRPVPTEPELAASQDETPNAKILPEPFPAQEPNPAPPASMPLSILSTEDATVGEAIPDRWRLPDGARIPLENTRQPRNPNLESFSKSLECLGFDADCAVQRKAIFAEEQLSGTDLVWMRTYANSGLSNSDFYGMSEAQIRERLGIPTAGKNGFMIFPGIAIDGPWWDALHGVNKACDYGIGINDLGAKQLMKRCKPLKPTSKDKIGFIPKPVQ